MERVLIEAAGLPTKASEILNGDNGGATIRRYEFAAMRDSLKRGENPVAASLMLKMVGVEDAEVCSHVLGLIDGVQKVVLYTDFGTTPLMDQIIDFAADCTPPVPVEMRQIGYDKCL